MLNEREIASAILITALLLTGLINPSSRTGLLKSFAQVGSALWKRKVIGVLLSYFVWIALCVWGAHVIGLWQTSLLKDTILTTLVVGLPLLFRSLSNDTGTLLLRDVAKEAVSLSAFVAFYLNLSPLPLWAEIILQFALFVLVVSQLILRRAEVNRGQRVLSGCVNVVLGLIGIGLLVWSTVRLIEQWPQTDEREFFLQLGLAIWLPLALFPFLYGFAYVAAVESLLLRVSRLNDGVTWREKLGMLVGLGFSLRSANGFVGRHLQLPEPRIFRSAVEHARGIEADLDQREASRLDHLRSLESNAGIEGVDAGGAQVDRREFHVTKEALRWLHTCQSGWYERQGDRFWGAERVDGMLSASARQALPTQHGIFLDTTTERTRWRAWRRLPNGWVLGIGSTKRSDMYLYSGPNPPVSFPGEADEWNDALSASWPIDWDRNDAPPR